MTRTNTERASTGRLFGPVRPCLDTSAEDRTRRAACSNALSRGGCAGCGRRRHEGRRSGTACDNMATPIRTGVITSAYVLTPPGLSPLPSSSRKKMRQEAV